MTWDLILQHLFIVLASALLSIVAGLPLGVLAYLYPRARTAILWVADLLQTIPSLALLGIIMRKSRALAEKIVAENRVAYGITTGFGDFQKVAVPEEMSNQLSTNLILSHCTGTGDPYAEEVVRGMLLLRANALCGGVSGIRPILVEMMLAMLNAGVTPVVPQKGSLGSSGDLAPLAHMTLPMLGKGLATYKGEKLSGAEAMDKAGIKTLDTLVCKEGLGMQHPPQPQAQTGNLFLRRGGDFFRHCRFGLGDQSLVVQERTLLSECDMLALKEKGLKKRLAYSTISQVSYVQFGLLLMTPGGMRGAFLQMVFHALAKDALFLAAGAIIIATNFTLVDQLVGIGKRMPRTMVCFSAAALSIIGIPPMSGFISKWYLASAALNSESQMVGYLGMAMLILSALMTAGYLLPIVVRGFFPGRDVLVERKEVGPQMTAPMMALGAAVLILGLFPNGLQAWISVILPQIF